MMEDEQLSDAAREEIAEAIRIARSDGLHVHKTYKEFLASQPPENEPGKDEPGKGDPPPPKDPPADPPEKKGKRGIGVWGNHE